MSTPSADGDAPVLPVRLAIVESPDGVAVSGEMDGSTVGELSERLQPMLERPDLVRLDLTGVTFIDSNGLRLLVSAQRQADLHDSLLEIVPSPRVRRVLEISGLSDYLRLRGETGHDVV